MKNVVDRLILRICIFWNVSLYNTSYTASSEDTITCYVSEEKKLTRTIFSGAYIFFLFRGVKMTIGL